MGGYPQLLSVTKSKKFRIGATNLVSDENSEYLEYFVSVFDYKSLVNSKFKINNSEKFCVRSEFEERTMITPRSRFFARLVTNYAHLPFCSLLSVLCGHVGLVASADNPSYRHSSAYFVASSPTIGEPGIICMGISDMPEMSDYLDHPRDDLAATGNGHAGQNGHKVISQCVSTFLPNTLRCLDISSYIQLFYPRSAIYDFSVLPDMSDLYS